MAKIHASLFEEPIKPAGQGVHKNFKELLRIHIRNYCEKSTIHCVRYLYDPLLNNLERLFWWVLLIISSALCAYFFLLLSERYVSKKLETVIENPQFPVFHVPFPSVAVCTDNRIDWSKLEAAKEMFLPKNSSKELNETFTQLVTRMETLRFGNFEYSATELEDINLEALDFIVLRSLAFFLAPACEDLFVLNSCHWQRVDFNCCELFFLDRSESGYCLTFNSELSPESEKIKNREGAAYYPKHNSRAGQGTGLTFNLLLDDRLKRPNANFTDNVYIMIKKTNQLTNSIFSITPNTETFVTVRPEITNTDETTRSTSPEHRSCLFDDEQQDFGTSNPFANYDNNTILTNCLNLCHESYVVNLCNCTFAEFFLKNFMVKDCKPKSLRCLSKHNDIFSYDKRHDEDDYFSSKKVGMVCYCLVNCNMLEYYTSVTTLPLQSALLPKSPKQKLFKVDVHYHMEILVKYRTGLEFNFIDFIANFGGIVGLCLGASMVSAVELIYYLSVGFGVHLYDNDYYSVLRHLAKEKIQKWWKDLRDKFRHVPQSKIPTKTLHVQEHPFKHKPNVW